jgi:hypothetical protein
MAAGAQNMSAVSGMMAAMRDWVVCFFMGVMAGCYSETGGTIGTR